MGPTFSRLTSLWFHVNWPSHSWDTAFSNFDLENPRSRSSLKVTKKVYHPIDSYPFRSMWIGHPFPELRLFWKFDLENQRSRSWVGSSSKSQCGSNILSIHIPFVPCQSALPFLRYSIFKIWPWKSRVKVMGEVTVQSHNVGLTSYRLTSLSIMSNGHPNPELRLFFKFDLENQGSRSWVGSQFKVTMWV